MSTRSGRSSSPLKTPPLLVPNARELECFPLREARDIDAAEQIANRPLKLVGSSRQAKCRTRGSRGRGYFGGLTGPM